jgi:hypothetical protein
VDCVMNEILTFVLAIYDETQKSFIEYVNMVENKNFKLMYLKQLHSSQKKCYKTKHGCKYGFPYALNKGTTTSLNYYNSRWEYFRCSIVIKLWYHTMQQYCWCGVHILICNRSLLHTNHTTY